MARTIADLEGRENIDKSNVAEALMFKQSEFLVSS
ncbi:MAG: hypothetical protein LBI70_00415 [Rickettsiales bacterium]|nr:hypothetical protein [Rickettsiales bacterium]